MASRENKIFWIFAAIHGLVWTLVPTFFFHTIPLRTAEGIIWGREWQWGSYKHPPLAAWLSQIAFWVEGHPGFSLYLLSQIVIVITFWAVWKFANKLLPPLSALAAIICLEGIYCFTFPAIKFSPDVLLFPIWALLVLLLYEVLQNYSLKKWLLVGLLIGLGLLTRYDIIVLLIPILIFLLVNSRARANFRKLGIYLALLLAGIIVTPHLIWLFNNDFLPINHAIRSSALIHAARVGKLHYIWYHLFYPLRYLIGQVLTVLPAGLLLLFFARRREITPRSDNFNSQFLLWVCLGPFLLALLASVSLGIKIRGYWTIPYFAFFGVLFLYWFKLEVIWKNFKQFLIAATAVFIVIVVATPLVFSFRPYLTKRIWHQNYPAQKVAKYITKMWHEHYKAPLRYIAGPRRDVSYIAAYATDRPSALINFMFPESPWMNMRQLRKYGAVFVTEGMSGRPGLIMLQHLFKGLQHPKTVTFKYLTHARIKLLYINIAFMPPSVQVKNSH